MSKVVENINPSHTYENTLLSLTVLGGVRLEGLDRMRVTMKVRVKDTATPPIRHNLDLYNDTQVEKFIRRAAEKLEVGTTVLTSAIATLTDQLEAWRLEEIKKQSPRPYEPPMLQAGERKAALELLQTENLLERTNELIGASGIIGEQINRLIMYLIFTSRKTTQHPVFGND